MNANSSGYRVLGAIGVLMLLMPLARAYGSQGRLPVKRSRPVFLQLRDRQLYLGNAHYRNIGATIPDLFDRFLRRDDASATRSLADAATAGIRFIRCPGTTVDAGSFGRFVTNRARWLGAFDRMLAAADANGISLVPSLLYDIDMLPAYIRATSRRAENPPDLLTPGTASNNLAVEYVTTIVSRYRDDPRVLFWEIGNEYNRAVDAAPSAGSSVPAVGITSTGVRSFLIQMARLIHRLDRRHLVTSGNGDLSSDAWHRRNAAEIGQSEAISAQTLPSIGTLPPTGSDTFDEYQQMLDYLNPPGVDIISVHQYPPIRDKVRWLVEDDVSALRVPWIQYACTVIGKPLFVGAFGQPVESNGQEQSAPWMLDFMRRMEIEGAPLAAVQDWEPAATDASATSDALSAQNTPRIVVALKTANAVIAQSISTEAIIPVPPPLAATEQAVQEDRLHTQEAQLHDFAVPVVAAARVPPGGRTQGQINTTGVTLHLPGGGYSSFRIRDAALMLGSDFIPPDEVAGWVRLIAARQAGPAGLRFNSGLWVPPYSIPDHIRLDGATGWFPDANGGADQGGGSYGVLPPADNAFWFIAMVHEHLRMTNRPTLFRSSVDTGEGRNPLSQVCIHAFDSVGVDAKTGLVTCGAQADQTRVDWGYADTVRKTGLCLMPSLLRYRAARDLAELFQAAGDTRQADRYTAEAERIKAALPGIFYLTLGQEGGKDTGMLLSATVIGRKDDLWASAYAVALGLLPGDIQQAIAQHLLTLLQAGGTIVDGQVRPLPPTGPYGGFWEQCSTPQGSGQNGGYWGLPVGWYVAAVATIDPAAANRMLGDYLSFLQTNRSKGAPWEWIDPARQRYVNPDFVVSAIIR